MSESKHTIYKYELLPGQSGFGDGSVMSDTQHTDEEQLTADAPLIIWTTGSQYIRKDEYDRLTRERDQYKLAAEMAQTSIIELQKERDALAERLSVAEELFASECEDPVNNPDAYLWYHGERHKKLAEDADNMTNPIFNGA